MEVGGEDDQLSRLFDATIMALVAGNVLAVILQSIATLAHRYSDLFLAFEQVSVAVFSVEFICRLWAAREATDAQGGPWRKRLRYLCSPMALIDLLAIAPFYIAAHTGFDLRFLRVLRLLRIVKLTRYSPSLHRVGEVFTMQRNALTASMFLLTIAIILSASILHVVEHEVQPEAFGSIPAAMWWAICTLTTVGYGDVTPITPLGKILASCITVTGIGMVALPTSLFAAGFAHVMNRNENMLREEADEVFRDGIVTGEEAISFADLAESLDIEPDVAREIFESAQRRQEDIDCPHCGKSISP